MQASRRVLLVVSVISLIKLFRNTLFHMNLATCRFLPSCSEYAVESIRLNGFIRGGWRALARVLRCHSLARGGVNPVR